MNWLDHTIRQNLIEAAGRYPLPEDGRTRLLQAARQARKRTTHNPTRAIPTPNPHGLHEGRRFSWTVRVTFWMMDSGVIL